MPIILVPAAKTSVHTNRAWSLGGLAELEESVGIIKKLLTSVGRERPFMVWKKNGKSNVYDLFLDWWGSDHFVSNLIYLAVLRYHHTALAGRKPS